jgi:hypothetical protein
MILPTESPNFTGSVANELNGALNGHAPEARSDFANFAARSWRHPRWSRVEEKPRNSDFRQEGERERSNLLLRYLKSLLSSVSPVSLLTQSR